MPKLSDCENLHRTVQLAAGAGRFICFTRVFEGDTGGGGGPGGGLAFCATDGVGLWKEKIEAFSQFLTDHLPPSTKGTAAMGAGADQLFTRFREFFLKATITLSESQDKLQLNLSGQEFSTMDLELQEAKAADKKKELPTILFHLADKVTETENSLKSAEKKIEKLEQKSTAGNTGKNVFDMTSDVKRKRTNPKVAPKAPGMSVINPGSKKRTAPKGVQFD